MKSSKAVKQIMKDKDLGTSALARLAFGKDAQPRKVTDRLSQNDITVGKLNELLRAMDYKIVVMPAGNKIPTGGYEIE